MPTEINVRHDIACRTERRGTQREAMLALGKSLTDRRVREIREQVDPCVVTLNHSVHIQGEFVVHEDYEQTQVNKVCPWTFLQIAWDKMNAATRNACIQDAQQMLREGVKPDVTELKEVTKSAVDAVKGEVKQTSKGQCKFNGTIWIQE